MSDPFRQALCCVCGTVRGFRRARNHLHENYWLRGPINRDWHRETGDLKCQECGQVTKHALLHPERDIFRDHAERLTRVALGSTQDPIANDIKMQSRLRTGYRMGRTPNPYLRHLWSSRGAAAARERDITDITAHCGEQVKLPPASGQQTLPDGPLKPKRVRREQEYEDLDTGMSWLDMDCVDCFRIANEKRLVERRKLLVEWLIWALASPEDRVPDERVDHLLDAFEALR